MYHRVFSGFLALLGLVVSACSSHSTTQFLSPQRVDVSKISTVEAISIRTFFIVDASEIDDMTLGPDGNLWFTEPLGSRIGRITPTGTVTLFKISTNARPVGITVGPDGNLWFDEGTNIGRITTGGTMKLFPLPNWLGGGGYITAGPSSSLYFTTGGNRIGRMTMTGIVTSYAPIPLPNSQPFGIARGADGNIWIAEHSNNKIGRYIRTALSQFSNPNANGFPVLITAGPDGNLWYTDDGGPSGGQGGLGRVSPSGVITFFPAGVAGARPGGITAGKDGNLWFTEGSADKLGRITPSGIITEFTSPAIHLPGPIAADRDGNLWFAESLNRIAELCQWESHSACR